jgi:hypothetical protein
MKIKLTIFIYMLSMMIGSTCYAEVTTQSLKAYCSPKIENASYRGVKGKPNTQFTLTSIGLEIAGETGPTEEGFFTKWDDPEKGVLHPGAIVYILAKCTPNGQEMDMFPDIPLSHDPLPTLVCNKGEGLAVQFISPNDPDPNKYIYHGRVTITRDDPVDLKTTGNGFPAAASIFSAALGGSR